MKCHGKKVTETGSHTMFSDVVLPYILNNIEDRGRMENVFLAVESLFELHDEYVDEVLTLSILENIYYRVLRHKS